MEEESSEGNNASSAYELHTSPTPLERQAVSLSSRRNKHEDDEEECNSYDYSEDCSEDSDDDEEEEMSVKELMYAVNSYHTIAQPVTITMVLAAMAVIYINTQDTIEQGAAQLASTYTVFSLDTDSDSKSTTLAKSFANALVMVCFICALTFVIVILYKFRFMRCLIAYMVYSSAMLLGVLGGVLFDVAIEKYRLPVDTFSFLFALYNFALVGVIAIFYQTGIPPFLTRAYLVATSVILSWQLSHFDDWTAWTLLIMLALYDLCAVLTPCGPLKALVNLMSKEDAPAMPGLLYEAQLTDSRNVSSSMTREPQQSLQIQPQQSSQQPPQHQLQQPNNECVENTVSTTHHTNAVMEMSQIHVTPPPPSSSMHSSIEMTQQSPSSVSTITSHDPNHDARANMIPLAIAKIYNLDIVSPSSFATNSIRIIDGVDDPNITLAQNYTPEQLLSNVQVCFPERGGWIEVHCTNVVQDDTADGNRSRRRQRHTDIQNTQYIVKSRQGVVKRVLVLDETGHVYEVLEGENDGDHGQEERQGKKERNSIRLGLGDFIFYSVLVSKAAQNSFTTFATCMLSILAGLGGTLVLLSVYQHALPALPISIFLGVAFYLLTKIVMEPWIEEVWNMPFYV
uniref:Presenilin n=1 Tax=Ditylum brightwellii TaxID=49249 RepID=A0A7S4S7H0_9STRA